MNGRASRGVGASAGRVLRVGAATVATVATVAALAAPPTVAAAQVTRGWSLCFTSRVASCSDFLLTTTPTLDPSRVRTGTFVDLLVRHHQGAGVVSGLQDFTFYFTPAGTGADLPTPLTPEALLGAPPVPAGAERRWVGTGVSTLAAPLDPSANHVSFANPTFDQFVGGCLGGAFDGRFQSPLATCGAQAYRFAVASAAQLDADAVTAIAVDVYAGDGDGDGLPDQATCNAPTDGGPGTGFDLGDLAAGDVCRVGPAALVTPEPAPLALLGATLVILAGAAWRRRPHAPIR